MSFVAMLSFFCAVSLGCAGCSGRITEHGGRVLQSMCRARQAVLELTDFLIPPCLILLRQTAPVCDSNGGLGCRWV